MQVEQQVMYTTLEFSLDRLAVTTCSSSAANTQQESSNVLLPLSMTGSVSLCKLPYKQLPMARAWFSVEVIEVTAKPQLIQLLKWISEIQLLRPMGHRGTEKAPQSRVSTVQAVLDSSWSCYHFLTKDVNDTMVIKMLLG